MLRRFVVFPALAFLFLIGSANAQPRDEQWNSLGSLPSGTRLLIERDGFRPLKAKFAAADGRTLSVTSGGKPVAIPRGEISAVYLGKRSSRIKRGMIGALAGAGAGFLLGGVAAAVGKTDPLLAAGGFLIGMPVGAVIGAASGGVRRGELIYSR